MVRNCGTHTRGRVLALELGDEENINKQKKCAIVLKVCTGGLPALDKSQPLETISAAPWALILPISYTYKAMMGSKGLTDASKISS